MRIILTLYSLYVILTTIKVDGYPLNTLNLRGKIDVKDEKRYPNGTVVGRYIYKDKDGNPVNVKYYADESSYGVELKSVKVFGSDGPGLSQDKLTKLDPISTVDPFGIDSDMLKEADALFNLKNVKNKSQNTPDLLRNYYGTKTNDLKKHNFYNTDYEILSDNEIKPSDSCNKERVRIYFDNNKRKHRSVVSDKIEKYCQQL